MQVSHSSHAPPVLAYGSHLLAVQDKKCGILLKMIQTWLSLSAKQDAHVLFVLTLYRLLAGLRVR